MTIFYSKKTNGFYDSSKISLDKIPADAKVYDASPINKLPPNKTQVAVEDPVEVIVQDAVVEEEVKVEVKKTTSKKSSSKN